MAFGVHPWKVVENSFEADTVRLSESLTSTGNGYMGMRGNFEEDFSGNTHIGTYVGGVWFPDKTRVGWWKNGYPQYFGKAINAVRLMGIHVEIDGEPLDLARCAFQNYYRELDLRTGVVLRTFTAMLPGGAVEVRVRRFVSLAQKELLAVSYAVTPRFAARVTMRPYLDAHVHNLDSNYNEIFWDMLEEEETEDALGLLTKTKENPFGTPRFAIAAAMSCWADGIELDTHLREEGYVEAAYQGELKPGETATLEKFALCFTSRDEAEELLMTMALKAAARAREVGFEALLADHTAAWKARWDTCDVEIRGDDAAQQGIRFNLFQMLSTYTGEDARLNIGPKGFTGEKYGGATYWDTEGFCFPVYMAIAGQDVARQLLLYRRMQLDGAYHNAGMQGLKGALYPMVTFNGVECHNEWEITFEEIHRNGAIAYAIYQYTAYTGDETYLTHEGLDVLCGIARFYADRVHYSQNAQRYMIHGVTGPNEYENNVNNNWYTNRIAAWCLTYFADACDKAGAARCAELGVTEAELTAMRAISAKMYYPEDAQRGIFVQQDTYLDKDLQPADTIPPEERPINQHWSWDKILRSCYIKQADVLQGLYFFDALYDVETKRRNFDFYEPMTVHESSLSPCVHAILAAEIGYRDKAVELYRRTARLDLDNLNHDTEDGLHITSMAGSWLAIVQGFAGMRTADGLALAPFVPNGWAGYSFQFAYRKRVIRVETEQNGVTVRLLHGEPLELTLYGKRYLLKDSLNQPQAG
ncbi:MAG: family 65 glycosyl hydrolase domain-containing protein [Candidatus Limiplasma sp.]|nr:family 65 glycosyl hydrolase domain-containing protein [Candidatus Limiplasma sp.]